MIADQMRTFIAAKLDAVAVEVGVRLLYAAESGSRAWGFPRPTATTTCASSTRTSATGM
jgi:hypothetical protein